MDLNIYLNAAWALAQDYALALILSWWLCGFLLILFGISWKPSHAFPHRRGWAWAFYRFLFGYGFACFMVPVAFLVVALLAVAADLKKPRKRRPRNV